MSRRAPLKKLALALGCLAVLFSVNSAAASAVPNWDIWGHHAPDNFQAGGVGEYTFIVKNTGDIPAAGPVQMQIELPDGVTTRLQGLFGRSYYPGNGIAIPLGWDCGPFAAEQSSLTCDSVIDPVPAGARGLGTLTVYVAIAPDAEGPLEAVAIVSGGAETVSHAELAPVGPEPTEFGIVPGSYEADAFDRDGLPERRAGAHPFRASAAFDFNHKLIEIPHPFFPEGTAYPATVPIGTVRNIETTLPRGFAGNPQAVARCTGIQFLGGGNEVGTACPAESQVGTIEVVLQSIFGAGDTPATLVVPVYNMATPERALATFAFRIQGVPIFLNAVLDPRDYSVVARVANVNETTGAHLQRLTLWGNPADPAHDPERFDPDTSSWGAPFEGVPRPFLSLPTECNKPDTTDLTVASWQKTQQKIGPLSSEPSEAVGCDALEFKPTIDVRPSTNLADAPSGLEFEMTIPQSEDPEGLATAHLRDAVVKLPAGMTVNPPSADGLGACSMAQVGIGADAVPNGDPVTCPDSSKLGTLEAESPAVDHPLKGEVYLAEQGANPFGSLIAMYLVIEDKETGVLVKLPGKVDPDPNTGQLTATFKNNPQLPVEKLRLKFFEGPHAALKTPSTCGTHSTTGTLTPWSAPEAPSVPVDSSFELTRGPGGGACLPGGAQAPNKPNFSAGTVDPTAKAFSPFVLKLARADGTQQMKAIDTTLPTGLVAKLAGTTYCSDAALATAAGKSGKAEKALPSCPASSHVGRVDVGAGAGSTPLYVQGQAYLAGPYKGAPLSLAIITPAVAGPFDLGTVVVRTALHVNPESAQVRAVSDELPTILQGIPLNVRSVAVRMDRPQFTLNPTSCDPMSIDGAALTLFNQSAPLIERFQVGECNRLGFKPKLQIGLKGGTKRGGHPALTATVKTRPGDANIAGTTVALPRSEFLAQDHIRTICTRVQFAADQCPQGSIYGTATAITPLLDEVLSGNVYLRSSSNPLPDIVIALEGKIDVDLVGRIDTDRNGGIRTTFASVPDAPVSKFTLRMAGGKKSLLENSTNLCRAQNKASVQMDAQNGKSFDFRPAVKAAGCKAEQRKQKRR